MNEHTNVLGRRAFVGGSAVCALSLFLGSTPAYAVTAAEKQAEADAALENLNTLQEQLDIASADYYTALEAQQAAQSKMEECQIRIDEVSAELSEVQDRLGSRARDMYRSGSTSIIDFLLGSSTFQEFAQNWNLLSQINQNDSDMVQQAKELRTEIETQKTEYEVQEQEAAAQAKEALQVKEEAENLVAQMQAVYDSLSAEAAQLLQEEEEARAAAEAAAAQAALEQQQAAEQSSNNSDNSSNNNNSDSGGSSSGNGSSSNDNSSNNTTSSSNTNNNKTQTVTGNTVVDRAYSQLGKPYAWGATGPDSFDCSGLVSYCLTGTYGVRLGTTYTFMTWTRVTDPQPGDVCTNSSHCGIYIGGGQMIHAPRSGDVVKVGSVQSGMIYVRY